MHPRSFHQLPAGIHVEFLNDGALAVLQRKFASCLLPNAGHTRCMGTGPKQYRAMLQKTAALPTLRAPGDFTFAHQEIAGGYVLKA